MIFWTINIADGLRYQEVGGPYPSESAAKQAMAALRTSKRKPVGALIYGLIIMEWETLKEGVT